MHDNMCWEYICSISHCFSHHLQHTQFCYQLYPFAVYCTAIAAICYTLNIATGYIILQYIVRLLPPFATHSILPLGISFCSILYGYCHHSQHTQYCHRLYPFVVYCMAIASIRYTPNTAISYIILEYIVWLLPLFATHSILSSTISFCSIQYCTAFAAICCMLDVVIGYMFLHYIVRLLLPFPTH